MNHIKALLGILLVIVLPSMAACGTKADLSTPPTLPPPPLAQELILYDWEDDIPQSVLNAFTTEYGVKISSLTYETQEEAIEAIQKGEVFDVVVMGSEFLPTLSDAGLLADLDFGNLSNFKNISANFRDLAYDPGNRHSVPFNWGTIGLLVRSDLVAEPVTRWADLWDQRYQGKVVVWYGMPRQMIGITLVSLGYAFNSESPAELEAALQRLLELKSNMLLIDEFDSAKFVAMLADGSLVIVMGQTFDMLRAREMNIQGIQYVMPEEGAMLWSDAFVVPANSPNKRTAELLINFLLRPEISAEITNLYSFATPNEAAIPFIAPEMLHDPVIFPSEEVLKHGQIILPLSAAGQKLYDEIWAQFMAALE